MSFLSGLGKVAKNVGKAVGKGVVDVGHFTGKVASNPIAQGLVAMIPGAGIPAAAIMGGLGNLIKPGGNLGKAAKGTATGALSGLAGKSVLGLGKAAVGAIRGGGGGQEAGDVGAGGDIEGAQHADQNIWGKINDVITTVPGVKSIEDFIKGHIPGVGGGTPGGPGGSSDGGGGFDWGKLAALGLGGAQMLNAANLSKDSAQYGKDALKGVTKNYASREPLRTAGLAGMLSPQTPNLSGLMAHSGPYGAGLPVPQPSGPAYSGGPPGFTGWKEDGTLKGTPPRIGIGGTPISDIEKRFKAVTAANQFA